jgi:hypothetical protein
MVHVSSRRIRSTGPMQVRGLVCICMGDVEQPFIRAAMRLPKPDRGSLTQAPPCPAVRIGRSAPERHPVCRGWHTRLLILNSREFRSHPRVRLSAASRTRWATASLSCVDGRKASHN